MQSPIHSFEYRLLNATIGLLILFFWPSQSLQIYLDIAISTITSRSAIFPCFKMGANSLRVAFLARGFFPSRIGLANVRDGLRPVRESVLWREFGVWVSPNWRELVTGTMSVWLSSGGLGWCVNQCCSVLVDSSYEYMMPDSQPESARW